MKLEYLDLKQRLRPGLAPSSRCDVGDYVTVYFKPEGDWCIRHRTGKVTSRNRRGLTVDAAYSIGHRATIGIHNFGPCDVEGVHVEAPPSEAA